MSKRAQQQPEQQAPPQQRLRMRYAKRGTARFTSTVTSLVPLSGLSTGHISRWRIRQDLARTRVSPMPTRQLPGQLLRQSTSKWRWPRCAIRRRF